MSTIAEINEEYFGKDKSKNYLKHDFSRALHGIIQRDVLVSVLVESSKARHSEQREKAKNGQERVSYGDFDPDNAGFLQSIFGTYEKGLMVDVRQLLINTESGAGGKFIADIATLTTDSFVDYYKTSKDNGVAVPRLLIGRLIENDQSDNKLSPVDFIDHYRSDIENAVNELTTKASLFQGKEYYKNLVKDYIGLKNHKDHYPEKYDVDEKFEDLGFLKTRHTTRKDKAKVEAGKIAECLNEFADIVASYQKLVGDNTDFIGSTDTLENYVKRTHALFAKAVPVDVQKNAIEETIKHLHKSLEVTHWRHDHAEESETNI